MRARRALLGAVLLTATASVTACGEGGDSVVVGGKNFTEQDILGEIVGHWIERTTDLAVERKLHLGGTFLCHRALTGGEIDLYVEYTGTALTAILELAPRQDPDSVYETVRRRYRERFDATWFEPLGFENTFAILVRREAADSLQLETVSDLVPHASDWTAGFGYEFTEREDGLAGLQQRYGLEFGRVRTMDLGLLYRALEEGQVDVVAGNSTDGRVDALDLVMLEDDRSYFPPYEAAPVVRRATLERHPDLRESLRRLSGRITTQEMRRLNREVDLRGRDSRSVAREWVESELADSMGARATGRGPSPWPASRRLRRPQAASRRAESPQPAWPSYGASSRRRARVSASSGALSSLYPLIRAKRRATPPR